MSFTLTTSGAILQKAGGYRTAFDVVTGSAADTSGSCLQNWCDQAEAYICAETRFDWVASYSALSTNTKKILDDVASNLAGMYAICYDMTGFYSRAIMQTKLDVLSDRANKGLIILKDRKTQDFMA